MRLVLPMMLVMNTSSRPAFHLAFCVDDLEAARQFYGGLLRCAEGRSTGDWIDFDFYGHQIVVHLSPSAALQPAISGQVDGAAVPVPHFGLVLDWAEWRALADQLEAHPAEFLIAPEIRFAGQPGEQGSFFLRDPAGNTLEFKAMRHPDALFAEFDGD